jgi:hypothetical protein
MKLKKEILMLGMTGLLASCLSDDEATYRYVIFSDTQTSTRSQVIYADQTKDTLIVLGDSKCTMTGTIYAEGDSTLSQVYNPTWMTLNNYVTQTGTAAWIAQFTPNTSGRTRMFQATISDESGEGQGASRTYQVPYLNISSFSMSYGKVQDDVYTLNVSTSKGTQQTDSLIFTIYDQQWTLETSDVNALQLRLTKEGEAQSYVTDGPGTYKVYFVLGYNATGEERSMTLKLSTDNGVENRIVIKQPKNE